MVNKRFNRKFRRALGAALGAFSVASISNVDVVNAMDCTETNLANDAELKKIFTMSKKNKERIFDMAHNISLNVKFGDPGSAKGTEKWGPHDVKYSYPEKFDGIGNWDGAYVVTFCNPIFPRSVRVTVLKSKNLNLQGNDYLIAPAMTKTQYETYATQHDIPWKGNWIKPHMVRPLAAHAFARKNTAMSPDQSKPKFMYRDNIENRWDPANPRPVFPGIRHGHQADCDWLTRWDDTGLMDASIWKAILGTTASKSKMFFEIDQCPPELRDFYYPPKKEEPIISTNTSSTPISLPTNDNINTANLPAVGLCVAAGLTPVLSTNPVSTSPTNVSPAQNPVSSSATNNASTNAQTTNLTQETNSNHNHAALEKNQIQSNVGDYNKETIKT